MRGEGGTINVEELMRNTGAIKKETGAKRKSEGYWSKKGRLIYFWVEKGSMNNMGAKKKIGGLHTGAKKEI